MEGAMPADLERQANEKDMKDALAYANSIIATLREPFLVLCHC